MDEHIHIQQQQQQHIHAQIHIHIHAHIHTHQHIYLQTHRQAQDAQIYQPIYIPIDKQNAQSKPCKRVSDPTAVHRFAPK